MFIDTTFCDGNGAAIGSKITTNYNVPFTLSLRIFTLSNVAGAIFQHHENYNGISFLWRDDSKLEFQLSNNNLPCCSGPIEEGVNMHLSDILSENTIYQVSLIFDGTKCEFHLNGELVGTEMDCSNGFESIGSPPKLCSSSGNGWNGLVSNVKFDVLKCKYQTFSLDVFLHLIALFLEIYGM